MQGSRTIVRLKAENMVDGKWAKGSDHSPGGVRQLTKWWLMGQI